MVISPLDDEKKMTSAVGVENILHILEVDTQTINTSGWTYLQKVGKRYKICAQCVLLVMIVLSQILVCVWGGGGGSIVSTATFTKVLSHFGFCSYNFIISCLLPLSRHLVVNMYLINWRVYKNAPIKIFVSNSNGITHQLSSLNTLQYWSQCIVSFAINLLCMITSKLFFAQLKDD